jgi:ABC-type multidrug transport system ATPase subunit
MAVHDVSFSIRPGMVTGFLASPMAGVLLTAP